MSDTAPASVLHLLISLFLSRFHSLSFSFSLSFFHMFFLFVHSCTVLFFPSLHFVSCLVAVVDVDADGRGHRVCRVAVSPPKRTAARREGSPLAPRCPCRCGMTKPPSWRCSERARTRHEPIDHAVFFSERQTFDFYCTFYLSLDQACLQLEPSSPSKEGTGSKEDRPRDGKTTSTSSCNLDRSNRDDNDLTSDTTWLTTAEDSSMWDAVESDFISSRLKQPARPTTPLITTTTTTQPTTHDQTTGTTETHDQNDDAKDDDTLLILSQLIDS